MTVNTIVYSAITASYDMIFKPKIYNKNIEYILFSDNQKKIKGWNVLPIHNMIDGDQSLTNRWYKFFPHEVFKDAEYSVYIDGNIRIIGDLGPLIQEFKESRAALGVFRHIDHTNIFQEVESCLHHGKISDLDKPLLEKQLKTYTESGLPTSQLLTDNGIIFRWHRHPQLSKAMSCWWTQLQTFSKRDQISLPYVVWKTDLPIKVWGWSSRQEKNEYFVEYPHRKSLMKDPITVICAYREDYRWVNFIYKSMRKIKHIWLKPKKFSTYKIPT